MNRVTSVIFILYITSVLGQSLYDYNVVVDHLVLPVNTLIDFGTLRVKKYNRTSFVLDGYINMLNELTDNDSATLQIYSFQGNEYRKLMQKNVTNLCTFLKNDQFIVSKLIGKTSLAPRIKNCPLPRGYIHFYNANFDDGKLEFEPGMLSKGKLVMFYYDSDGELITSYEAYFIIERVQKTNFIPKLLQNVT